MSAQGISSSNSGKTPYNSIYEQLQRKPKTKEHLTCCVHGAQCAYGAIGREMGEKEKEKEKTDDNYVNLSSPSKEEKMASQLASRLGELAISNRKKENPGLMSIAEAMKWQEAKNHKKSRKSSKTPMVDARPEDDQSYVMLGSPGSDPTATSDAQSSFFASSNTTGLSSSATSETTGGDTFANDRTNSSSKTLTEAVSVPSKKFNSESAASAIYLGVLRSKDAECHVLRATEFALYHQLIDKPKLNSIPDGLPLILIYRTSTNLFRHLPIRSDMTESGDVQYFVDYGRPNVRKHYSLNQLVKYHQVHVSFDYAKGTADVFSSWG